MRWCRKDLSVYPLRPPNLDALHEFEADEIGMFHLGFMEGAVAGFDSFLNGGFPVIVPVLLIAHQRGGAEHRVDHLRVCTRVERYHGTQGAVGFGLFGCQGAKNSKGIYNLV